MSALLCVFIELVSLFIFYGFSSTKSKNRRAEQVLWGGGCWHWWEGEVSGKEVRG
jgi:hypothetical protein